MSVNNNSPYRQELEQVGDYLNKLFHWFSGKRGSFYFILIGLVALVWLASGAYIVQPGEEGAVPPA